MATCGSSTRLVEAKVWAELELGGLEERLLQLSAPPPPAEAGLPSAPPPLEHRLWAGLTSVVLQLRLLLLPLRH